jgi:hypothetical protein
MPDISFPSDREVASKSLPVVPTFHPDAEQTQEAHKLEGLFAGAADGDFKAVNALQEELQGLRKVNDPEAYIGALNTQFNADQKNLSKFPNLRIDYEGGRVDMWSNGSMGSNTFSEDANGGLSSDGHRAYPPTPGSMPFEYSNGADRIESSVIGPQTAFIQNLEFLATGAQEGNPLDRSKLQAELKALAGSSPDAIDRLNSALNGTAEANGVFDLPTFNLTKEGNNLQMDVWYPYDGRQFSESSSGITRTTTQVPLVESPDGPATDGPDVRSQMPELRGLDVRVPKY